MQKGEEYVYTAFLFFAHIYAPPVLQLISHRSPSEAPSTGSQSDYSPCVSPSPPPQPEYCPIVSPTKPVHVRINLQNELWPTRIPCIDFVSKDVANPQTIQLAPAACTPNGSIPQDMTTSILPFLCSMVQFPSPFPLLPQSTFIVYANGSNSPMHMESAPVKCLSSPADRSGWLYSSELVPGFWGKLCSSHGMSTFG